MNKIKIRVRGVVQSRGEVMGLLQNPGDVVIIQRGTPRWFLMMCPCGCNEELPVNLDARSGKAWRLYQNKNNGVTVYPSVWRDTGCKSHFIVSRNVIYLFARRDDEWDSHDSDLSNATLQKAVYNALPSAGLASYVDVADRLGEIPWDVLDACRFLVREGRAREGLGKERGQFCSLTTGSPGTGRSWLA